MISWVKAIHPSRKVRKRGRNWSTAICRFTAIYDLSSRSSSSRPIHHQCSSCSPRAVKKESAVGLSVSSFPEVPAAGSDSESTRPGCTRIQAPATNRRCPRERRDSAREPETCRRAGPRGPRHSKSGFRVAYPGRDPDRDRRGWPLCPAPPRAP
jgi:hypothetical protein